MLQYFTDSLFREEFVRSPLHNAAIPLSPNSALKSKLRITRDLFIYNWIVGLVFDYERKSDTDKKI